jgi:mono/diheme cytochrome c family protein
MKPFRRLAAAIALVAVLLAGCGAPPGKPRAGSMTPAPNDVVEFNALYGNNCAGCHGANGRNGAAIALADPVYLAIVDHGAMRASVANGVRGTSMPAFAQGAGGMLTDKQIDALVNGIRSCWSRGVLPGANRPSYFCQSCHGSGGEGGNASAITNDSFLALTSDQALRTIVIVGRPDLGAPDWRGNVAGRPMSDQEVTDVVSWLASHRVAAPGQPYVTAQIDQR